MSDNESYGPLEPLLYEAETKRLWLVSNYDPDLWFSPAELRAANAKGEFRWGPINWRLEDPNTRYTQLKQQVVAAEKDLKRFEVRVGNWRESFP